MNFFQKSNGVKRGEIQNLNAKQVWKHNSKLKKIHFSKIKFLFVGVKGCQQIESKKNKLTFEHEGFFFLVR